MNPIALIVALIAGAAVLTGLAKKPAAKVRLPEPSENLHQTPDYQPPMIGPVYVSPSATVNATTPASSATGPSAPAPAKLAPQIMQQVNPNDLYDLNN